MLEGLPQLEVSRDELPGWEYRLSQGAAAADVALNTGSMFGGCAALIHPTALRGVTM